MAEVKWVVIGGGIVGLSSALALQRRGVPTMLVDPAPEGSPASWGNAGHVAIEQAEPIASMATLRSALRRLTVFGGPLALPPMQVRHWAPFAWRLAQAASPRRFARGRDALSGLLAGAMPAWQRLAATLPDPDLLRQDGHIVAWHDPGAAARGLASWQAADTGTARFRIATADDLANIGQVVARPPAGAIVFTNTGQVADPGAVLGSLRRAFTEAGGQLHGGSVTAIEPEAARLVLHGTGGLRIEADRVLVAAGVRSGALLARFGLTAPIIAERGYHIQAAAHRWPATLPPVVFEERSIIVTRFRSGLRAAGFVEFGGMEAPPNPRRWARLETHVGALGLPIDGPLTRWSGARPTLPDYLPAIGQVPGDSRLVYAFGHQHLGLTLGPITAEIVAALATGEAPPLDLRPFDLRRFSNGPSGPAHAA